MLPGSPGRYGEGMAVAGVAAGGAAAASGAGGPVDASVVHIQRGALQIALPADQFARSVAPVSPRSAPSSAPTSPRGDQAMMGLVPGILVAQAGDGSASPTSTSMRAVASRTVGRRRALSSADPQLSSLEAEIREWRTVFKATYGYYPGTRDVSEVWEAADCARHRTGRGRWPVALTRECARTAVGRAITDRTSSSAASRSASKCTASCVPRTCCSKARRPPPPPVSGAPLFFCWHALSAPPSPAVLR